MVPFRVHRSENGIKWAQKLAYGFLPTIIVIGVLGSGCPPTLKDIKGPGPALSCEKGAGAATTILSARKARAKASAASLVAESASIPSSMNIPRTGNPIGSWIRNGTGHPAPVSPIKAASISVSNPLASPSPANVITCQRCGRNFRIFSLTLFRCFGERWRSAIFSRSSRTSLCNKRLFRRSCSARSMANAASFRVSSDKMSLNVWRVLSAQETYPSKTPSPATPNTIRSHPTAVHTFIRSETRYSLRHIEGDSQYLSSIDFFFHTPHISWAISGNSQSNPMPTIAVDTKSLMKYPFLKCCRSVLMAESNASVIRAVSRTICGAFIIQDGDSEATRAMVLFLKFLTALGIASVIIIALCAVEFTIGINRGIKRLFSGNK